MYHWFLLLIFVICFSCKRELVKPEYFPPLSWPEGNEFSNEKVLAGKRLFFDPVLSINRKISCGSCHIPDLAFTDGKAVAKGLKSLSRSTPSLFNIGFHAKGLFWDGNTLSLEKQALIPVSSPLEMGLPWVEAEKRINKSSFYSRVFKKIYGDIYIDSMMIAEVLAQFQRTLIAGNSKYDLVRSGKMSFTPNEKRGWAIFFDADPMLPSAECSHCHVDPLFTDLSFQNNGIHSEAEISGMTKEKGRELVTKNRNDRFKFKVPTLRNIVKTAPYMHDGRFKSLDEVLNHYNNGGNDGFNVSPNVRKLNLTEKDKQDLIAFLHTLTDLYSWEKINSEKTY